MINCIQLIRNLGIFDSASAGPTVTLDRITLIYAENGRGKTTIASILRSAASDDPIPVSERSRLRAEQPPHVVLNSGGDPAAVVFSDGAWSRALPEIVVFDDTFVDQNIFSGLAVDAGHRQNLHELILGAEAITINKTLQGLVQRVEQHNAALRDYSSAIPSSVMGELSVADFCALPVRPNIDELIAFVERQLAAVEEQEPIRATPTFEPIALPSLDVAGIEALLQEDLPALGAAAELRVREHLSALGRGGEGWVGEGLRLIERESPNGSGCPFCAQELSTSSLFAHYNSYSSVAYTDLKKRLSRAFEVIDRVHGNDLPATFERAIHVAVERRQFWSRFCDVPEVRVDTAAVARDWKAAREAIKAVLQAKLDSPLEPVSMPNDATVAINEYQQHILAITVLDSLLGGGERCN